MDPIQDLEGSWMGNYNYQLYKCNRPRKFDQNKFCKEYSEVTNYQGFESSE